MGLGCVVAGGEFESGDAPDGGVGEQGNEVTVTLPADVVRDLDRVYEAYRSALDAVVAAHDGDQVVLAQARHALAAEEGELAEVYDDVAGQFRVISRAVVRAVHLAAAAMEERAITHERAAVAGEAAAGGAGAQR